MLAERLSILIHSVTSKLDYEFWGLEIIGQGSRAALCLYIDRPKGINVNDCSLVSRKVEQLLALENDLPAFSRLEVSSPGLERPLFTLQQYQRFVGCVVSLELRESVEGLVRFTGLLKGILDEQVIMELDGQKRIFPFQLIRRGRLVSSGLLNKV